MDVSRAFVFYRVNMPLRHRGLSHHFKNLASMLCAKLREQYASHYTTQAFA